MITYYIYISLADTCSSIVSPADSKPRARRHSTLTEGGAQPGPGTARRLWVCPNMGSQNCYFMISCKKKYNINIDRRSPFPSSSTTKYTPFSRPYPIS